ncbi:hypothetical protein DL98DRAFT_515194 [Cadophora sp. DSE1049]|nr:hypothetical protein DL98DRAFT_515194 [Cadophora sp. DSE1049]
MKILITYATTSGTTRSIAERIQVRIDVADFGSITFEPVETKASVDDFGKWLELDFYAQEHLLKSKIRSFFFKNNCASRFNVDAIIIGSCIHAGSWMRKGKKFVKNNTVALRDNPKPTWAFSVGMPPESQFGGEEKQMNDWLSNQIVLEGHKLFYGAYQEKEGHTAFQRRPYARAKGHY